MNCTYLLLILVFRSLVELSITSLKLFKHNNNTCSQFTFIILILRKNMHKTTNQLYAKDDTVMRVVCVLTCLILAVLQILIIQELKWSIITHY